DAEERGVGADADRQREQGRDAEAARVQQRARAVAEVLQQVLEPGEAALVAPALDRDVGGAQVERRQPARLGGRRTAAAMALLEHLAVECQLLVERSVVVVRARRRAQAAEQLAQS